MKKIGIFLMALFIILTLAGCTDPSEVDNALEVYCENNPDSTICTNPDATRNEIVANMFNTIMIEFVDGTNEAFCTDYFAHEGLIDDCENNRFSLLPDDYADLSSEIDIVAGDNASDFVINTTYSDETDAYSFNVSVIESAGVIKFTTFSYMGAGTNPDDNTTDLKVTDEEVMFFMRDLVAYYNPDTFVCSDLLVDNALADCLADEDKVIGPLHTGVSPDVTSISENKFLYQIMSNDGLQKTSYTILFDRVDGVLKAKEISYVKTGTYNELENATTQVELFVSNYNSSSYNMYDACMENFVLGSVEDACYSAFEAYKTNTITNNSIVEKSTGTFEVTFVFDNDEKVVATFNVIVGEHGWNYRLDATFEGNTVIVNPDDPVTSITDENRRAFLLSMFDAYHNDSLVCSEYFTSKVTEDCTTFSIFNDIKITDVAERYYSVDDFIVMMYHNYGEDTELGYVQIMPTFHTKLVIEEGKIKINEIDIFDTIDATTFDVLIDELEAELLSTGSTQYLACGVFEEDAEYCRSVRDSIYDGALAFSMTPYIDDSIPTRPIYYVDVMFGSTIKRYMVNMYSASNTEHEITSLWTHDTYDTNQGDLVVDVFTDVLQDSTVSSTDFCTQYDLGSSCEQTRDDILASSSVTATSAEVVVDGVVYEEVTYEYVDSTGATETLTVTVEVVEDSAGGFTIGTVQIDDDCNCTIDDDCDGLITNEILLDEFFEMFFKDYNDSTVLDSDFSSKYNIPLTATLITERTDVLSNGGAGNISVTTNYDVDNVYQSVTITYTVIIGTDVYVDTNVLDVYVETNTTFRIVEESYVRVDGVNEVDAETRFELFIIEYMNTMISDIDLSTQFFGVNDSPAVDGRFTFLLNAGKVEYVSVSKIDGVYYGTYKETQDGVTTTYSQEFTPYKGPSGETLFVFGEKVVSEPVVTEATETTANTILIQFVKDLQDDTLTDEDICNKYYGGSLDCVNRLLFTMNNIYLNNITFNEVDTPTWTMELQVFSAMSYRELTWVVTLATVSDGTYLISEVSNTLEHNMEYGVYNILDLDEENVRQYINEFHNDYFDTSITNADFCDKHWSWVNTVEDFDVTTYCDNMRNTVFLDPRSSTIQSTVFKNVEFSYDPSTNTIYKDYVFSSMVLGTITDSDPAIYAYNVEYNLRVLDDGSYFVSLHQLEQPYGVAVTYTEFADQNVLPYLNGYTDYTVTSGGFCDLFNSGDDDYNQCVMDRNYAMNFPVLSEDVIFYVSNLNTGSSTDYRTPNRMGGILLVRMDKGNGFEEAMIHKVAIYKYGSELKEYSDWFNYYSVLYSEDEYETYITSFIDDYFDTTKTDSYITSTYGLTLNRATDLASMTNVQVYDVFIDRFTYTYPSYYVVLTFQVNNVDQLRVIRIDMMGYESSPNLVTDYTYLLEGHYIYQ